MKRLICIVIGMVSAHAFAGEPCQDNFRADGTLLVGKTYATWAILPGVSASSAFDRALAFTAANGFTVVSSDQQTGMISSMQSEAYARGKQVPLNVQVTSDNQNARIGINYTVTGLAFSPEDAIKRHFCLTFAAAKVNSTLTASPSTAQPARRSTPGLANPTSQQLDGYRSAVLKNVGNERLRPLVKDAAAAISSYIEKLACVSDYEAARVLEEFAAPETQLRNQSMMLGPIRDSAYHDKSTCLSVLRVHGWSAPADNALRFEAVYKADDSGQTAKVAHEAVRQPDGTWLFLR